MVALYWMAAPEIIAFAAFILGLTVMAAICVVAIVCNTVRWVCDRWL